MYVLEKKKGGLKYSAFLAVSLAIIIKIFLFRREETGCFNNTEKAGMYFA